MVEVDSGKKVGNLGVETKIDVDMIKDICHFLTYYRKKYHDNYFNFQRMATIMIETMFFSDCLVLLKFTPTVDRDIIDVWLDNIYVLHFICYDEATEANLRIYMED